MSTNISTVPMFMLEYFFKIMAMMSVPPLDAPILKRIAVPTAGRKMANISSKSGWLVSGALNGQKRSRSDKLTDMTMVAYTVFNPKPLPRNKNPNSRRAVLVTDVKSLAYNSGKTGDASECKMVWKFEKVDSDHHDPDADGN